ncbi:response regulator [Azospirillum canadense]|uniref:response regulator n=1 Tax=Azospirillum canadense TaxID=403962 RepID=UPI002227BB2D|nr:response regulator [Azospirillum canadense]MCW2236788.1 CheY-like chemotaxis protein [Azospirillum canadense]
MTGPTTADVVAPLDAGHADPDGGADAPVCREPDEFYTAQARDTIGRYCQRFFDENALTPTELLHSPKHQQSLSNTPTFVAILQQAERAMDRKGALTALVNEVARLTRERLKDALPPDLTPATYAAAVARLTGGTDSFSGRFRVDAALTTHLYQGRSFAEKARLLLDLGAETEDADALAPIDRLLGEIVRSDSGTASCAQDAPFADLVEMIVTLIVGDRTLPDTAPSALAGLERLIRRTAMPALCDGLIVALRRELSKPHRFTITSSGDLFGIEAVQREIMALSQLAQRLRTGEGYFGGERTEASLQRRTALLVNEDTLPEITKGRSLMQKLRILFVLQKMPLSPSAARAVNGYVRQFFDGRDFAGRLLDCWKERHDKLKGLGEVQKLVLDSDFPEDDRAAMAQQVDEIQNAFIRTQRLLGPLQAKEEPNPDLVLDMVRLAGEGAFCTGKSRTGVAKLLYRQVHRPRFVRSFLLGAAGGKERSARASWLRGALAEVGVPFIDLGSLRALVVDDEEGPRRFVASVLQDLGIGHIDTAVDGQDALDRLAAPEARYDLIVCDWMMPKASGLDVLKRVRETRHDLPFLMVTALATLKAVQRALAFNVSAYIAKPFTPEQLEDKIFLVLTQKGTPAA